MFNHEASAGDQSDTLESKSNVEPMVQIPDFPGAPTKEKVLSIINNLPTDSPSVLISVPNAIWKLERDSKESGVWRVVQRPPQQTRSQANEAAQDQRRAA